MDDEYHVAVADCLRGRSRTANTSAACGFDGGDCSGGRIFLPAAGVIEFGCDRGVVTAGGEAVGAEPSEFSAFVFGYRMNRRIGVAVAGRDGGAVCPGASRMARRDEGCLV